MTTIQDHFSPQVKKYLKRKEILVVIVCLISFLCGLPNMTQVTKILYCKNSPRDFCVSKNKGADQLRKLISAFVFASQIVL